MSGFFNVDNAFFTFMGKVCDIILLSIVWMILCIPIVTIGPATTALYYTTVKVIRRERGYVFREFFSAFKSNFKNGTILGVIITILFLVLHFDRQYAVDLMKTNYNYGFALYCIFNAMGIILICITLYIFPVLSRFQMKRMQIIKTSLFMSIKHLPSTILMIAIIFVFFLAVMIIQVSFIFAGATCALVVSLLMERIFKKYMPKADESAEEDGKDEWYLE